MKVLKTNKRSVPLPITRRAEAVLIEFLAQRTDCRFLAYEVQRSGRRGDERPTVQPHTFTFQVATASLNFRNYSTIVIPLCGSSAGQFQFDAETTLARSCGAKLLYHTWYDTVPTLRRLIVGNLYSRDIYFLLTT